MRCKAAVCFTVSFYKVTIDYLGFLPFLSLPFLTFFFLISLWFTFLHWLNIYPFLPCIPSSFLGFGILLLIASLPSTTFLPLPLSLIFLYPFSSILSLLSMILHTCLLFHNSNLPVIRLVIKWENPSYNLFFIPEAVKSFSLFLFTITIFLPTAIQTVY